MYKEADKLQKYYRNDHTSSRSLLRMQNECVYFRNYIITIPIDELNYN